MTQEMTPSFFERPILNSPYRCPARHWELEDGQPTNRIVDTRRRSELITPVPQPKRQRQRRGQREIVFDEGKGLSTAEREEIKKLRKENAELAMERDVLKRSVALWVKDAMGR